MAGKLLMGYGRSGYDVTKQYPGAIPVEEVNAELFNWECREAPLFAVVPEFQGDNNVHLPVNRVALYHSETGDILGVPSQKYSIHQFQDSLTGGLRRILGEGLAINSAGLTRQGALGWVSVSLADTVTTAEGVEFLPHLIAYGSHDSSLPTGYKRSTKLMICNNMVSSMLREKTATVKVRHTKNSGLRLESAQQALAILHQTEDEFSRQVKELCEIEVSKMQWDAFLKAHRPLPEDEGRGRTVAENELAQLRHLYTNDDRCATWAGTAFGVIQTVNTHSHHYSTVRGADRWERNSERALTGFYDALDGRTLRTLESVLAR